MGLLAHADLRKASRRPEPAAQPRSANNLRTQSNLVCSNSARGRRESRTRPLASVGYLPTQNIGHWPQRLRLSLLEPFYGWKSHVRSFGKKTPYSLSDMPPKSAIELHAIRIGIHGRSCAFRFRTVTLRFETLCPSFNVDREAPADPWTEGGRQKVAVVPSSPRSSNLII
jgi:hypothetical protein